MRIPIRTKLIVAIVLPLVAVYLGALAANYYSGKKQAIDQAKRHLSQVAANHAARLESQLALAERSAVSIAQLVAEAPRTPEPQQIGQLIGRNVVRGPLLHSAAIILEPEALASVEAGRPAASTTSAPTTVTMPAGRAGPVGLCVVRPERPRPPPQSPASRPSGPRRGGPKAQTKTDGGQPPPGPPPGEGPGGPGGDGLGGPAGPPMMAGPDRPPGRPGDGPRGGPPPPGGMRRGMESPVTDLASLDEHFDRQDWYVRAKAERKLLWLAPVNDKITRGQPVCRCVMPILRNDVFLGAVAFDVELAPLQRYVAATDVPGGYCMLVAQDGLLLAHPDKDLELRQSLRSLAEERKLPAMAELADKMAAGQADALRLDDPHTAQPSWAVFAPMPATGWSLAVVAPERQLLAQVQEWFRRDTAVMLGGLGLIIAVVLLVSIRITRPIGLLARAVRKLAEGDLSARVRGVRGSDELAEFARAFNGMVRALHRHVQALTRATAARKAVEDELRIAREIQTSLLPRQLPRCEDFEMYATNVPAKQVAGDFFDFFFLNEETLAFLIADVSGKGMPAALYMAVARTTLRNAAMAGAAPADVLNRTNRMLARENERGMFVTLFFAHYHLHSGRLLYANAGHNPPCVGRHDGAVRSLNGSTGPMLGIFPDYIYQQRESVLAPRDTLVLYTDGVTEAMDDRDEQFHLGQLEQIVGGNPSASPEEMCGLIVQSVERHSAEPRQDDVTLLVLRRRQ